MKTRMQRARAWALVLAAGPLAACASAGVSAARPGPAPASPRDTGTVRLAGAIRWVARSAEYRALARQTYAEAAHHLDELVPDLPSGRWGVILDADETVLNNIGYAERRLAVDSEATEGSWAVWVHEEASPAVPGAAAFTHHVHVLGGRVVIVTNRADSLCGPTRANLRAVGVEADLVLCMPPGQEDKNQRFARVQNGTAARGFPPLDVVEWLGDNIQDFPHLTQRIRADSAAFTPFGRRYFVLPNPVYGSWEEVAGG